MLTGSNRTYNKRAAKSSSIDSPKILNKSKSDTFGIKDFNHGNTSRRLSLNKDIKSERFSDKTRKSNITSNANKKLKEGKSKNDLNKLNLETKIRDLMALAQSKDTEISSLKIKLDQMMHLLDHHDDVNIPKQQMNHLIGNDASNTVEMQEKLNKFKKENRKLKEKFKQSSPSQLSKSKASVQCSTSSNSSLTSQNESIVTWTNDECVTRLSASNDDLVEVDQIGSNIEGSKGKKYHDDCASETSSVTVACLTERLHQMEESHISTHEELEATVQELADLQRSIPELTIDNNRLQQEKNYMELKVEMLEKQLVQLTTEAKHFQNAKEVAEQEHAKVLQKLEEVLHERSKKESCNGPTDQLSLENQSLKETNEILEEEANHLHHKIEKMDTRISELEEEQEAAAAKNKCDLSELSELIDRLQEELQIKQRSLDEANETLFVMEDSVEQHLAVKKHDKHVIQQLRNQLSSQKEEKLRIEKEIDQLKKEQRHQSEEWKQFQNDLQMAVMIANDMKAETQSEVSRLREENQSLEVRLTQLQVENEQLRRNRFSSPSSDPLLCSPPIRRSDSPETHTLHEVGRTESAFKLKGLIRRPHDSSLGVQGLIKSFNRQTSPSLGYSVGSCDVDLSRKPRSPASTATVSPLPRKPVLSIVGDDSSSSLPTDATQLSNILRHNSTVPRAKNCSVGKKESLVARDGHLKSTSKNSLASPGDPLACLSRYYGGSKRNALLKWCQEKTSLYSGVEVTNFSSSWSDGFALCALLHSYLPAHIPYDMLRHNYDSAGDDASRQELQAKNFCLAFAAAEKVGIEASLSTDDMMTKERPDWQRVMAYVTQIYKCFET